MNKTKVMISIPAYNEEKTIVNVINEIKQAMGKTDYDYFIHVLDDGSIDNTMELARKAGAVVHSNNRNRGLSFTFQEEVRYFLESSADIFVHTDADGQYLAGGIPHLIKKLESGYDLVLGSRFKGKIRHMPIMKKIGNLAFAYALSKMTGAKITDSTTGFRCFNRNVAKDIEYINTFTYTQEQIIRAAKQKFRISEVGISSRRTRESRLFKSSFQYAVRAWINIFRIYRDYNPIRFFGRISIFLFILSFGLFAYVFFKFIQIGIAQLDEMIPSIILATLCFLTGLQILLFGFLADMNRK